MATQKRSSSGKRTTTGKKTTAGGKRTAAPKKRPIRREVGGVVCLVLALCIAFSYFQQGGWLLDQPAALCRGLVGYGYYTVAPVLLLVSYILLFHRGRNVTACVVGAALLPVLLGAMLHLVLCKTDYNSVDGIAKLPWQSGLSMESGGRPLRDACHHARQAGEKDACDDPARGAARHLPDAGLPPDARRRARGGALA